MKLQPSTQGFQLHSVSSVNKNTFQMTFWNPMALLPVNNTCPRYEDGLSKHSHARLFALH